MQLNQNQLISYLNNKKNSFSNIHFFLLHSDDNFLLQDYAKQLKQHVIPNLSLSNDSQVQNTENTENTEIVKIIFHIDSNTDWLAILNTVNTPGLFCEKQLIEIHFLNKITLEEQKYLNQLAKSVHNNPDLLCIILCPYKLDNQALKQKWITTLDEYGLIITIWPLSPVDYPKWLSSQAQKYKIIFSDQMVFDYFCQKTMCNPNIADQTLYKLQLQNISLVNQNLLTAILSEHASYDIFDLIDNYLIGNIKQTIIILNLLKSNTEPLLILWALRKELHTLATINEQSLATNPPTPFGNIIKNLKLWSNKINIINTALKKYDLKTLYKILDKIASIEPLIKTENNPDFVWQQLHEILLFNTVVLSEYI